MLQNYFKTALRSIIRERYYALIKITGLALGLGTTLVLLLYVSHQLSYDESHPDVDRLYRINQTNIWDPNGGTFSSTGPAVASSLLSDFPEIEQVLRVNTPGPNIIRNTKAQGEVIAFNEENILAADSNFFEFFDFKLKEGNAKTALVGIGKVVISDAVAKKLFGDAPALGKTIQMGDDKKTLEITGVTETQPTNIHFHFDYLLSIYTNPALKNMEWSWIWTQVATYVKVKPNTNTILLDEKLRSLADRHAPATFQKLGMNYSEFIKEKGKWNLYLQPVRDIHLHSGIIGNRLGPVGDSMYVYVFIIVAIFILLLAIINFVNLSTARGIKRAKEVGVKKALGLERGSLIIQFQIEHILVTAIAMLLGLGIMEILRLVIQPFAGIEIPLHVWSNFTFGGVVIITPIVIGFLAGLYPAFYLTSFQPAQVLKGKLVSGLRTTGLRNALVIFQFTVSIALMASTLIVFQQVEYFQNRSLGFDKDNMLIINHADKIGKQLESFREELTHYQGVLDASVSMDIRNSSEDLFLKESDGSKITMTEVKIDEHFFSTYKFSLLAGHSFDINRPSDKQAVIINETSARLLNWKPEDAIGKKIVYIGDDVGAQEVIGVVKDFNFQSLKQNIAPLIFYNIDSKMWGDDRIITIKFNTPQPAQLVSAIQKRWGEITEGIPFEYSFLDQDLQMQYQQEQHLGSLFSIFTALSITIAVIGLIGLVAYSAEQRKKEIGIRKVFGASLVKIYVMMNTQYIRLMVGSLLIATPLAWWLMQQWLNTFVYRVTINPVVFFLAGLAELVLALLCVGYLALRAASLNPAQVLKEE